MLSGIKTGKRKRKVEHQTSSTSLEPTDRASTPGTATTTTTTTATTPSFSANYNAAQELRRMLSSSSSSSPKTATLQSLKGSTTTKVSEEIHLPSESQGHRVYKALNSLTSEHNVEQDDPRVILLPTTSNQPITLQKEDFKRGARKGKLSSKESWFHADQDKSIQDLIQEEKQTQQQIGQGGGGAGAGAGGIDEIYARNIARLGSRYKASEFKSIAGSTAGADEEDMVGDGGMDMTLFVSNANTRRLTEAAKHNRQVSQQIARVNKEQKVTSLCWWWMESSSFQKHRLLSLGDHVSLVFVPSHLALVESQCYLVPIKHSESFASCEDEVWEEVTRFRTSLRNMFAKEDKGVLFCETVLPTKGLWQARMDVIPVPKTVQEDAEIFFQSALVEQSDEWGTHNKILSTRGKGLRRTIPKGFPYFNVEWDDGGYAQMIETNAFPKDFGVDTIAGMMDLNPVRFDRKPKAVDYDRAKILDFVKRWKDFDWTLTLDKEAF